MTASPQDAPSGDSLPSRSDAGVEGSLSGPAEAAERPVEAAASMGYVDHWFKVADKIANADRQVVSDLHARALRRLAKVEKRAKRDRHQIRHLEAMLDDLERRQA